MQLLEGHTSSVHALAFSPDGRFLASGTTGGTVSLHDEREETPPVAIYSDALVPVSCVAFSPSGDQLGVGLQRAWGTFIRGWGDEWKRAAGWSLMESCPALAFLSDQTVVVGTGDRVKPFPGTLALWDIESRVRRRPTFTAPHGVRAVDVHRPSKTVAWAEWGGYHGCGPRVHVWEITKPDPIEFTLPKKAVSLAFHPDGGQLAAAIDWGVTVFDLTRRQERLQLKGHKGAVSCVAASPDGRRVASGSWDGTVRVWDWATGAEVATFAWPVGKVYAVAYSPDGLRLAAAGEKGTIILWDAD